MDTQLTVEQIRELLQKHVFRTYNNTCPEFKQFIIILNQHPTWKNKIDSISNIRITRNKQKAIVLYIKTQLSRRYIQISWRKCCPSFVSSYTEPDKLKSAFRNAIHGQINQWRKLQFGPKQCAFCHSDKNLQVDHMEPSFSTICNEFKTECKNNNILLPTEFDFGRYNRSKFKSNDNQFVKKWKLFHQQQAKYQFLCATCNRKKGNRNITD